jgi:RHS repeat-associated protein
MPWCDWITFYPQKMKKYSSDKQGRLTKAEQKHSSIKNQKPNSYNYIEEFSYDNQGNILKHTITDKNQKTIKQGIYDIDDRTKIFDNTNYVYNTDGYLISKIDNEGETTYTYGTLGELREVVLPNNTKVTYIYNANNQRSAKLINNQIVEKYLWLNLTTLLAIYDKDDNLITRFYYLDDRVPYKVKHNNQIYYLSYNHIGSLKQITDTNGQIVKSIIYSSYGSIIEDMNYDSFGNIINDTNPSNTQTINIPIGFAGGLYDKDTKLTKFGYREYDSYTGRWTSKDPIRYEGGDSNLYGYVLNDPINFVDVEGLNPISIGVNAAYWDFTRNYIDMRVANTKNSDKYFHCKANCEAASRGAIGYAASVGISEIREISDQYIKNDSAEDCNADREANDYGRQGGAKKPNGINCQQICDKYRPNGLPPKY